MEDKAEGMPPARAHRADTAPDSSPKPSTFSKPVKSPDEKGPLYERQMGFGPLGVTVVFASYIIGTQVLAGHVRAASDGRGASPHPSSDR
jgi:hypothetical protein